MGKKQKYHEKNTIKEDTNEYIYGLKDLIDAMESKAKGSAEADGNEYTKYYKSGNRDHTSLKRQNNKTNKRE